MNQPPENPSNQPNQNPSQPNPDSPQTPRQDYQKSKRESEEIRRLQQEELQLKAIQRKVIFERISNSIYFLVGSLEILLGIRFFLRLSGANPDNTFAKTIYNISDPFVAPFSTLFISPSGRTENTLGDNIFDLNLLIAMAIYAILCSLALWLVSYIYKQLGPPTL